MKRYFKCEIKPASRSLLTSESLRMNRFIVTEPNHCDWTESLWLNRVIVNEPSHCEWTESLWMNRVIVNEPSHCDWTESLWLNRIIVIEPNHLNDWFIQERITVMLLRDTKQCCSCVWSYLCWRNRAILCLKHNSLNINSLLIELLYKINITFIIMLTFEEKNGTLHVILTIWNDIYTHFLPISWILWSFLMHFIKLKHNLV